ncbi:ANTAR domain-containing protein [Saccharothrix sp. Mg75]|uniref:ANTAR domain-containing protein n=1 Tax=Saccharothrix sp. Mg75 TaxID=3445357 RepID=UPI003EEEBF7E
MAAADRRTTGRTEAAGYVTGAEVRVDVAVLTPAEVAAGEAQVVTLSGELDAAASTAVAARLAELVEEGHGDLVVDLTGVRLLSGAGVTALFGVADALAGTGRRLRIVAGSPAVTRVLRYKRVPDVVDVHGTVDGALGAQGDAVGRHEDATVLRLAREVRELRAKLAGRPVIARAMGMLQERYLLPDSDSAFALLRGVSQRANVRMRDLAETLVDLPRPCGVEPWPPAAPAPALGFSAARAQGAVLSDLLDAVVQGTWAVGGEVRLAESGGLRVAVHLDPTDMAHADTIRVNAARADTARPGIARSGTARPDTGSGDTRRDVTGLGDADPGDADPGEADPGEADLGDAVLGGRGHGHVVTLPTRGDGAGAVTAWAARRRRTRVVVADVTGDPLFAGSPTTDELVALGARALVSTPLLSTEGECLAVVTTFHESRDRLPTAEELADADGMVEGAARWLEWSRRERVRRALEHLHAAARTATVPPAAF